MDRVFDESQELFVVVREYMDRHPVNCQLNSGWRLGKCEPGVNSGGEGLVEAAGESIKIEGLGFCESVWVGACQGDSASVVDLCDEAFREETVGLTNGGSSYVCIRKMSARGSRWS